MKLEVTFDFNTLNYKDYKVVLKQKFKKEHHCTESRPKFNNLTPYYVFPKKIFHNFFFTSLYFSQEKGESNIDPKNMFSFFHTIFAIVSKNIGPVLILKA